MGAGPRRLLKATFLLAALSSILAAAGTFLSPWHGTMPFRSTLGLWVTRIAVPVLGGTVGTAVQADSLIWIASVPIAALCLFSLFALLLPIRGTPKRLSLTAGLAGLAGGIVADRAFQLGLASDVFGAWHVVALLSSLLFGLCLVMAGVLTDVASHGPSPRTTRTARLLLVLAGGAIASFALLPVGVFLLAASLIAAAFVFGRSLKRMA